VAQHARVEQVGRLAVAGGQPLGGEAEVVCGAPNVAEGQKICFAPENTVLPGGFKLERRKIRGVESAGMVLSERELER
jgi:phenylalanyl-tRNA synthetase beta chain